MNGYYKYIHVFYHDELKFSKHLLEFFHDDETGIDNSEHYFVTPHKSVYEGLKEYDNVEYIPVKVPRSEEIVNKIGDNCNWIFLHNICGVKGTLKFKHKYAKKIIWRYWGAKSLEGFSYTKNRIKNSFVFVINRCVYRQVHRFKAIGVANDVDVDVLKSLFGEHNYFREPYPVKGAYEHIQSLINNAKPNNDGYYRIMVGHSGFDEDKHIKYVEELKKHCDKGLKLYMVLSYGDSEYIEKVKNYVSTCGADVEIIDDFLEYNDFVKLLCKMDAAILDAKYSYALGNIGIYLRTGKKLFLNADGVLAQSFSKNGVPFVYTKDIKNMSFEELTKPLDYSDVSLDWFTSGNYNNQIDRWKMILNFLNA